MHKLGKLLAIALPLACYAVGALDRRRARSMAMAAAVSTLAGAAIGRYAELEAGKVSAKSAGDYLRYAGQESRA